MDDKTQKERLEQELRFLKESFEAEVISKEEFEKGKGRIEKKLQEINSVAREQKRDEAQASVAQAQQMPQESLVNKEGGNIKLKVIQEDEEDTHDHEEFVPLQIKINPEEKIQPRNQEEPKKFVEEKRESRFFKYAVLFVILALIVFFYYSYTNSKKDTIENKKPQFMALCSSDSDCVQQGKNGICINSGSKDAKCELADLQKTSVIVLNDKNNCFNCDTSRVLSILEVWFGHLDAKEINYSTNNGKSIAKKINATMLPAYIFGENITSNPSFGKFKQAFVEQGSNFVLSENAAGSTYYIARESIPNKLDLFVIEGDGSSAKAENNLKEFLNNFKDIKFEKHLFKDKLAQELEIKTFPTFLLNNKVKFSGVISAETIKNNFCQMNKVTDCSKNLSRNLV